MPPTLAEYFFETLETVFTSEQKRDYEDKIIAKDYDPGSYYEMTCISHRDRPGRLTFCTSHIFFEDLADVGESLGLLSIERP